MRTRLSQRKLPDYSRGEELFNMISHIVGAAFSLSVLLSCVIKSALQGDVYGIVGGCVYGLCSLLLYCMSSIYHGLRPSTGKKVLQILDHCAIYFMIAGTYTPVALCALRPEYPALAWSVLGIEWALAILAVTFNAIDLKRYAVFSILADLVMGWLVILFAPIAYRIFTKAGFLLLLFGGISYTVGAVFYGIGSRKKYFHSIFHIFVLLGSILQYFAIYLYVL